MTVKLTALYMNRWSSTGQSTDRYINQPALPNLYTKYFRKIPVIVVYEPQSTTM
jgi:hypothetical protein